MKNFKTLTLAFLSILAFSCSDSDDETTIQQTAKWRLANVSGGFAGVNQDFEGETITWEFNNANNTVTIVNNNTSNPDIFDGPDSGNYTYGYTISEAPQICTHIIEVNNIDYGCVDLSNDIMTFNNTYADGFKLTFEKITTNQAN